MVQELNKAGSNSSPGSAYPNWGWSSERMLRRLHGQISGCFARAEPRERAWQYMLGLAGRSDDNSTGRRNVASYSRETRADGAQRLLTTAQWDDADARRELCDFVRSTAGAAGYFFVVEATFPKKGNASAGVEYQHRPESGRVQNCQSALFLLQFTPDRRLFMLDLGLYMPQSWIGDRDRRAQARIPDTLAYRSKSAIARDLILTAMDNGFRPDRVYLSMNCRDKPIVLEVLQQRKIPHLAGLSVSDLDRLVKIDAAALLPEAPKDETHLPGETLPRKQAVASHRPVTVRFTPTNRWDSRRTSPFYRVGAGYPMSSDDLLRGIAELRHVERRWQGIRDEIQIDKYEVRSWRGWYRHMTFAMTVQLANELTSAEPVDDELGA